MNKNYCEKIVKKERCQLQMDYILIIKKHTLIKIATSKRNKC